MPDEPSPNLSVAHGEFSPCWSEPRDILHCLTRERQTHDTDNNTYCSNDPLGCRSLTEQFRSHVRSGEGCELSCGRNVTYRSNPHGEQNENVAQRAEHTHYYGGPGVLARLAHCRGSVSPRDRREHEDAQTIAGEIHNERRDGQHFDC